MTAHSFAYYDPGSEVLPAWTRDGRSVYYSSRQGPELRIQQADGSGSPRSFVVAAPDLAGRFARTAPGRGKSGAP